MDDRARLLKQAPLIHVNQLTAVPLILQQRNLINGGVSINRRIALARASSDLVSKAD
jgi:hypothetical protein